MYVEICLKRKIDQIFNGDWLWSIYKKQYREKNIMSKRKNLFKISIVTSVLLLSSIAFYGSTDVMASNPINYKNMPEYAT